MNGIVLRSLRARWRAVVRVGCVAALAPALLPACGSDPPTPLEPVPEGPLASSPASRPSDPLVIASDPNATFPVPVEPPRRDPPPIADSSCALSLRRAPRPDCRAVFPLSFSASQNGGDASKASDGDTCTIWNAGGSAPQSVTIDLGVETRIDAIVLVPEMTPNGSVRQAIAFSKDGRTFEVGHRVEAPMQTGVGVDLVLPKPETARFVRVTTEQSPSWVAWREIGLFRCGS
jgi:hypothetical protein